ncbi:hypothetical protein NEMBOFW57_002423 [Staphylotrichum longicolle]|uniref:ABM domain-containing protein n=1 Tax=Staphylotrichum longicolle TaxID=669026 RepID=A0AAD4F7Z5_9PEZI|nr:hypothetical protein NEMBOFW57_002423 [Staphylotrichum longicolle]
MATTSPVIVFQTLDQPHQPPAPALEELKKQDGLVRAFYGVKMEDPQAGVLCTEWSSRDAAARGGAKVQTQVKVNETLGFDASPSASAAWERALMAPCTEVFTAFGAEDGFVGNVWRFVSALDVRPPEGYEGAAVGEGIQVGLDDDKEGEVVVRMVIGWVSREAHLEAKGKPGAIQDNIHELRTLRRAVELFHVPLKEI